MTGAVIGWMVVAVGVAALALGFFGPSRGRREIVLRSLSTGAKLGSEVPLPRGLRYVVLDRMEQDGQIESSSLIDGRRMYRLSASRRGTAPPDRV